MMAYGTPEIFLNELKAAILSGVEMEFGDNSSSARSKILTVDKLRQISNEPHQWPARLRAAYETADKVGAMPIVFDALAVGIKSDRWAQRVSRRAWWYLMVLIAAMITGWIMLAYFSSAIYAEVSAELQFASTRRDTSSTDPLPFFNAMTWTAGAFAMAVVAWGFLGGPRKALSWAGGQSIKSLRQSSVALRVIESLNRRDVSMPQAIDLATEVVAADQLVGQRLHSTLASAVTGEGLSAWARSQQSAVQQRMTSIELWFPLLVATMVGGILAVFYCLAVYQPIINILMQLATAADRL